MFCNDTSITFVIVYNKNIDGHWADGPLYGERNNGIYWMRLNARIDLGLGRNLAQLQFNLYRPWVVVLQ